MSIRFAEEQDSTQLLRIYAQYIDTAVTFEYELPTEQEFAQRIRSFSQRYPYLVWEQDGKIIGYAYAHRQAERAAYGWNAEVSIYLDRACLGGGIGTKLYSVLLELLHMQGIKTVYALVTSANAASMVFHESVGFHRMAVQRNTGYKNGAWHDIIWMEKQLAAYEPHPRPVCSIHDLPQQCIKSVMEKASINILFERSVNK